MWPVKVSDGERERLEHGENLRDDENTAAVHAVDPDAGDRREEKMGICPEKATIPRSRGEFVSCRRANWWQCASSMCRREKYFVR